MAVTTIDIDYYEELKAKADLYEVNEHFIKLGKAIYKAKDKHKSIPMQYTNDFIATSTIYQVIKWAESEE